MKNVKVTPQGGNQYLVETKNTSKVIDLDGVTIISNEDYDKIVAADLDNDTFLALQHSDGDPYWEAAVRFVINYSGFDVDEYIENNL